MLLLMHKSEKQHKYQRKQMKSKDKAITRILERPVKFQRKKYWIQTDKTVGRLSFGLCILLYSGRTDTTCTLFPH